MSKKIKKIGRKIMWIIVVIVVLTMLGIAIYIHKGGESFLPEYMKKKYDCLENEYSGRTVFVISPKEEVKSKKTIFYIHGGAYLGELSNEHWDLFDSIITQTGYRVIAPDYPLTPKYTYQDVFSMLQPLYEEIVEEVGKENLILIGDSAGGGISLGLAQWIGEEQKKEPNKVILISPWLDVRMENSEIDEVQKSDPYLNKIALKLCGEAYAGSKGMKEYIVNPIDGPLEKLKNVIIYTGTNDILNPDVRKLNQIAENRGADIIVKEVVGARHNWILKRKQKEYMAEESFEELINDIKEN